MIAKRVERHNFLIRRNECTVDAGQIILGVRSKVGRDISSADISEAIQDLKDYGEFFVTTNQRLRTPGNTNNIPK